VRIIQSDRKVNKVLVERIRQLVSDAGARWARDAIGRPDFLHCIAVAEDTSARQHKENLVLSCVRVEGTGRSARWHARQIGAETTRVGVKGRR
jgi:hypothetical protein